MLEKLEDIEIGIHRIERMDRELRLGFSCGVLNVFPFHKLEQFKTENFYIEKIEKIGNDDKLSVTKTWYKDGKYKVSWCTKNDADGSIENLLTEYQDLKSNQNEKYDKFGPEHFADASRQAVIDMIADIDQAFADAGK